MKVFISLIFFITLIFCQKDVNAEIPILRSLLNDSTIVFREGIAWSPPNFETQGKALGLEEGAFLPPANLQKAVDFWIKIYTQYQSHQGLIHDLENLNIVYEKVDFDFIDKNDSLNLSQKAKARENLVDERKKIIFESLKKLAVGNPDIELNDLDKGIRKLWEKEGGSAAINEAADLGRIRFQLGQSDRIKEAIFLSGRYLPMMESVFKKNGLPLQLTRIVFVESSFNIFARSKVGASGLWQIMPSAAKGNLRINKTVDLRNHPKKATELAAKMLRYNYQLLNSWPLAITGYNHGPYGVKRLVEKNKTRDLGDLISTGEGRRFGFASRNFYASFLAALAVEGKANEYFPGIRKDLNLAFKDFKTKQPIIFSDLIKSFNGNRALAQLYNPHLQRNAYLDKIPLDSKSEIMVPLNHIPVLEQTMSAPLVAAQPVEKPTEIVTLASEVKSKLKLTIHRKVASKEISKGVQNEIRRYRVHRGDTIYRISRHFKVRVQSILSMNNLKGFNKIKPGQVLILPD